jgi:hypothetical protein
MSFEDIPEDKERSFPCECGGEIKQDGSVWKCDKCKFSSDEVKQRDGVNGK